MVIHLIDAEVGLTDTDKKISDEILKAKKPIIIAINKWDMLEKDSKTFDEFREKLIYKFYRAEDFPIISISAKNMVRIYKIISIALELQEKSSKRIETAQLNKILTRIQNSHRMPQLSGKIKIFYATQIETSPPEFKLFVNNPGNFRKDIVRYFEKSLQKELNLNGIPMILHLEGRKKSKAK